MQGDFSWDPFNYSDAVSRVLYQEGRVQLDRDFNENTESILRFLRGLGRDLIGAHGGVNDSFQILPSDPQDKDKYLLRWGQYYVDGIRCLNLPKEDYWQTIQSVPNGANGSSFTIDRAALKLAGAVDSVLFYLDVYERHVSSEQDDSIRELALLGPDTSSRAVVTWKVRAMPSREFDDLVTNLQTMIASVKLKAPGPTQATWIGGGVDLRYVALNLLLRTGARMRAKASESESTNPCTIAPEARYRGTENRLFRVEIHDQGRNVGGVPVTSATFKWSRDNASIVYPIRKIEGVTIHLDSLGRDARTRICVNDWVEVVDDHILDGGVVNPLLQVMWVSPDEMTVKLSAPPTGNAGHDHTLHPILRRWESDVIPIETRTLPTDPWIDLADGVQVQFSLVSPPQKTYRTGDYWLIPTRTATGNVVWSDDNGLPRAMPPNGVDHHYAPLAKGTLNGVAVTDLRFTFKPWANAATP
jgi:hypothetical protein